MLAARRVGVALATWSVLGSASVLLAGIALLRRIPPAHTIALTSLEGTACMMSATVFATTCFTRVLSTMVRGTFTWTHADVVVFGVNLLSAVASALLASTPVVAFRDPYTGYRMVPLRWLSWCTSLFLHMLAMEGVANERAPRALSVALTHAASVAIGAFLPFAPSLSVWCVTLVYALLALSSLYVRAAQRLREPKARLPPEKLVQQHVLRITCACALLWPLFLLSYAAAAVSRASDQSHFVAECLLDALVKLVVATCMSEVHVGARMMAEHNAHKELQRQMKLAWEHASDTLLVSQALDTTRHRSARVHSVASLSIVHLMSERAAHKWLCGHYHELDLETPVETQRESPGGAHASPPPTGGAADRGAGGRRAANGGDGGGGGGDGEAAADAAAERDVLHILTLAWQHGMSSFECTLTSGSLIECEVRVTQAVDEHYLVVVMRDVTERERARRDEMERLERTISKRKDEEANRFTRHKVKNSVLSAIAVCDEMLDSGVRDQRLARLHNLLNATLHTIGSVTVARDVVNGMYTPKVEPVRLDSVFADSPGVNVRISDESAQCVSSDRWMLHFIYHNALSNAVKYGADADVDVRVAACDGRLQFEVENKPGANHAVLRALEDPTTVFSKGTRFHDSGDRSAGDGAWIAEKCAHALNGSVSITFDERSTTFAFDAPMAACTEQLESVSFEVPQDCIAVGIDDDPVQRMLLGVMLSSQLRISNERVHILGDNDDLCVLKELLVQIVRNAPARVLILCDENLDVGTPTRFVVSGSLCLKEVLQELGEADAARVLGLVRSANDGDADVLCYLQRVHGFVPKLPLSADELRKLIAHAWSNRFVDHGSCDSSFDRRYSLSA